MDDRVARYIREFGRALQALPNAERRDAIREIQSHLDDEVRAGKSPDAAIARLGRPKALARSYLSAYHVDRVTTPARRSLSSALSAMLFFATAGAGGLVVVPALSIILFTCGVTGLVLPFAGIARTLGATWVSMSGPSGPLPVAWSIPVAIGASALCLALAWGSWQLLRLYFRLVERSYRRWRGLGAPVRGATPT